MTVYKCDRCGEYFEDYDSLGYGIYYNAICSPTEYKDLCPKCKQSLIKWYKIGGKNGKEPNTENI